MARMLSPDDACKGVDVPLGRARSYNGRVIEVTDPSHVRALREIGYTVAGTGGAPARSGGYQCPDCSFKSWFKTCGRCGSNCQRAA